MGGGGNALWFRNDPAAETGAYAPNTGKAYHLPTGANGLLYLFVLN